MSLAISHFAFGAAMTTIVVTLLPRVRYPRTATVAGGVWAMLPDLHMLSPVAEEPLLELHRTSLLMDIFWLHGTIDRLDPEDSLWVAVGLVTVYLLVTAAAERRNYGAKRPVAIPSEPIDGPDRPD